MPPSRLDCIVVGYNDDTREKFQRTLRSPTSSPEYRIFNRDHLLVDGEPLTYMDVINRFRHSDSDKAPIPFYHVCEVPNLAATYLYNFLTRRGLSAEMVGFYTAEREKFRELLRCKRPRSVAITTTFYEDPLPLQEIVDDVRRLGGDTTIIVGGPLVFNLATLHDPMNRDHFFDEVGADYYVFEPQGERTLADMVRALREFNGVAQLPNVYRKTDGRWRMHSLLPEDNSLSEAIIDWRIIDPGLLGTTIQTRTARSCAYSCAFCDYPKRAGRLTFTEPGEVIQEIRQLVDIGISNVIFVDDTFNVPEERFREICRLLIVDKIPIRWFSYFRCSSVKDVTTYDLMKRSGCQGVFLGIESGDDIILKNMAKIATVGKYMDGIKELKKRDILTFASFIAGYPGETATSIDNTIRFINEAGPDLYRIEPWWYNKLAPVSLRAEEFQIRGEGYRWKHASMDIDEACDAVDRVFAEVVSSYWCPQQSFSFWAIPYLIGKGMSADEIKAFHSLSHCVLQRQCAGLERGAELRKLQTFVGQLRLSDPLFFRAFDGLP